MPVAIRLSRIGSKHKPFFRMVVVDSRKKRDGAVLENIGTYDAVKGELIRFETERFDAWVKQGAQPSDTAKKLYRSFKRKSAIVADPKKVEMVAKKAAPKKVSQKEEAPKAETSTQD